MEVQGSGFQTCASGFRLFGHGRRPLDGGNHWEPVPRFEGTKDPSTILETFKLELDFRVCLFDWTFDSKEPKQHYDCPFMNPSNSRAPSCKSLVEGPYKNHNK